MKWISPVLALLIGLAIGSMVPDSRDAADAKPQKMAPRTHAAEEDAEVVLSVPLDRRGDGGEAEPIDSQGGMRAEWLDSIEALGDFEQIGALYAQVRRASPQDFPALIESVGMLEGTPLGWQAQSLIAARWAEVDPRGFMAHIEAQPEGRQWGLSQTLFSAWARNDPSAAYAAAQQLPGSLKKVAAISAITAVVSIRDPERAIEMVAAQHGNTRQAEGACRRIFSLWGMRAPEVARAAALAMEDGPAKTGALSGVLTEWIQREPLAALEWLDSMPADSTVYNSRKQVFNNLLRSDLNLAKEYIESRKDPLARKEVFDRLGFSNLAGSKDFEEIEGLIDWVGTVATGRIYDRKVSQLVSAMAESDSARAIEYVMQMSPGNARMNSLSSVARKLAQTDPAAALAFVESLQYADERERVLGNMAWAFARSGIEGASALVAGAENPEVQQTLSRQIASEWSSFNREAALSWAESLSDTSARDKATQAVLRNWIQSDPAAVFEYIENSVGSDMQGQTYRSAFSEWSQYDPEATVQWLAQLPESAKDQRSSIYRSVTRSYVQHDPMAASEWIGTLEAGEDRDRSVQTLVGSISKADPEAGFIWATTVGDETIRQGSLEHSLREWVKLDAQAAYEAVEDARIEAAQKTPLFEIIEAQRAQ